MVTDVDASPGKMHARRMDLSLRPLDPERHRRRLRLLAELAQAKATRAKIRARRNGRSDRIRDLIALRRGHTE